MTVETLMDPEGASNNPELTELMNQTVPETVLETGDGSANPAPFEAGQVSNPTQGYLIGGVPMPQPLSGVEREYIWGPGDNGLDELLVQYDMDRKPWWMIQDGGGDVVAMCDLDSSYNARVVRTWQYDAYGKCISANQLVTSTSTYKVPVNRCGHKGLFVDRLDVGLTDPSTYVDNERLVADSTSIVLYENRNRTYSPQLGRFIQRDPNESGQLLATADAQNSCFSLSLRGLYHDGGSNYCYLGASPWQAQDPSGLLLFTQADGYAVEAEVQRLYLRDHPTDYIVFGNRYCRLLPLKLKPDILNLSGAKWAEVKPFSQTGVYAAARQAAIYTAAYAPFGILPDGGWTPSTHIVFANGKIFTICNIGGIIFYSFWEEVEEELAIELGAIGVISINSAKMSMSAVGRTVFGLLMNGGSRSPVLAGVATYGEADAEAGSGVGTFNSMQGMP